MASAQFGASTFDWLLAAAAFFVLLPGAAGISFVLALTVFLIAAFAGNASQVPGGSASSRRSRSGCSRRTCRRRRSPAC